jgi:hypothetical protein
MVVLNNSFTRIVDAVDNIFHGDFSKNYNLFHFVKDKTVLGNLVYLCIYYHFISCSYANFHNSVESNWKDNSNGWYWYF